MLNGFSQTGKEQKLVNSLGTEFFSSILFDTCLFTPAPQVDGERETETLI